MVRERLLTNLLVAFESLASNRLRSLLTALGVIFGVAAVIAMLAIGNGAKKEVLDQIALVGVNNIVITPMFEEGEDGARDSDKEVQKQFSPGLSLLDAESLLKVIPSVERISPEVVIETSLVKSGKSSKGRLVGVDPFYFEVGNFELEKGRMFNSVQLLEGAKVCIIGQEVRTRFFAKEDPIGKYIKCGPIWLKVVGVLREKKLSDQAIKALRIRNFNLEVYTPIRTVLIRYQNRARTKKLDPKKGSNNKKEEEASEVTENINYHQLDRLTIKVSQTELMAQTAELATRMLLRRHQDVPDFEVRIPEQELKQKQRTQDIFTTVLAVIAGISLLVGGIGIMNIMLASVLERIKEIGLRLSLGARKNDIVFQFVFEAVLISASGGLLGVLLGVVFAYAASIFAEIETIISGWSILISFTVSLLIGLIFGIMPAKRAAEQNPINSLRHD
ncbi:MAG: ABC transporter permease [Salibacteraceae bacterium]